MKKTRHWKLFTFQNIVIFLFLLISLLALFIPYFRLDVLISDKVQMINSVVFNSVMWFVSTLGNEPYMVLIVGLTSILLYLLKFKIEAVICSLSAAGSALSGTLIKILIGRPRPVSSLVKVSVFLSDKSYPSNHVLVFTVFFGFILYVIFKNEKYKFMGIPLFIIFSLLVLTIGLSRIYLGAHWASDVLGGFLLGLLWLIFAIRLYNSYNGKR